MSAQQERYIASPEIMEEAFQITWAYLQGSGQIVPGQEYDARVLVRSALTRASYEGTLHKLILANKAIRAYEQTKHIKGLA